MFIKSRIAINLFISALLANSVHSNPTSKEYVDNAFSNLRQEMAANNYQLQALIAQLSNQFNDKINALANHTTNSGIHLTNKIEVVQNQVSELPIITHQIGDRLHGGIVFYVDASRQHGLIAASIDASEEALEWRNGEGGDRRVNAHAQGLGAGETNTRLIVAEQTVDEQDGQFAALIAANYQVTESGAPCASALSVTSPCFGGWYLPSVYELMLIHTNLKQSGISELSNEAYWSSSEASATEAWLVDFENGDSAVRIKSTPARIRPIHNF